MGNATAQESNLPKSPDLTQTAHHSPSVPTSKTNATSEKGYSDRERPSVRGELKEIKAEQKEKQEKRVPETQKSTAHKQPKRKKKSKSKRGKSR